MEPAFFPLDERLQLASYQQTTRRLERLICEVGLLLPDEQAADVLNELLGITIAGRQVERIVDRHGQRAIAVRDGELEAAWAAPEPIGRQPAGPAVLYIEGGLGLDQ